MNSRRSFSKGALKINSAVQLTQSHECCMVKFQLRHYTAVQLVFDEHWAFLMDSKLHFRRCLRVQAPNYSVSHMYVTHLQLLSWSLFIQTETMQNTEKILQEKRLHEYNTSDLYNFKDGILCIMLSFVCTVSSKHVFFPLILVLDLVGLDWMTPIQNSYTDTEN